MKRDIPKTAFFLAVFLLLPTLVSAAAPTITGVSGLVATGQTLTITGSNMVQENTTNWQSMFKSGTAYGFEGSGPAADGYLYPYSNTSYSSSVKLMGNKSLYVAMRGASSACGGSPGCQSGGATLPQSAGDNYYREYIRYDNNSGEWPNGVLKLSLMNGPACGLYIQPASYGSAPTTIGDSYGSLSANFPGGPIQNGRWYLLEIHYRSTSSPLVELWIDGKLMGSETSSSIALACNIISWELGVPNWFTTSSSFSMDMYTDGVTVSTSRIYPASTIEISNSATYGSGTTVYQPPLYLSDGSIQVKADLTGLGSGPYYLWVTNNGQTRSAPYNLSGGGGDTTRPAAPTGLRVK